MSVFFITALKQDFLMLIQTAKYKLQEPIILILSKCRLDHVLQQAEKLIAHSEMAQATRELSTKDQVERSNLTKFAALG